jgi:hypothetical protein
MERWRPMKQMRSNHGYWLLPIFTEKAINTEIGLGVGRWVFHFVGIHHSGTKA